MSKTESSDTPDMATSAHDYYPTARVLLEMRPALDGFYGIPQETRLLFAALSALPEIRVEGLLQMSTRQIKGGVAQGREYKDSERIHQYSKAVISLKGGRTFDWKLGIADCLGTLLHKGALRWCAWSGLGQIRLKIFETPAFRDFIWQQLFARSVPPSDQKLVLRSDYRICAPPWRWMHMVGIERAWLLGQSCYPRLDTRGVDVFIAQTPYPARMSEGTALVVHYHDAIPVLMPHTISDRAFHEASHFHALAANVRDGAYFVCVSEATRRDLLSLFPQAEPRSVTIHNMLSAYYYPGAVELKRVPTIVQRYLHNETKLNGITYKLAKSFSNETMKSEFYAKAFGPGSRFILMVSTIEPRKNHMRLIEAWEVLRDRVDRDIKLVLVGHIGWDCKAVLESCLPWIEEGGLFMLHSVPADSMRILYNQAAATVCPSVGEGFDLPGVEAMRCDGVVAASNTLVHREVFGDAALYFDPYDTQSVAQALQALIYDDDSPERTKRLRSAGLQQSAKYLPERIMPQWAEFLRGLEKR